MVLISHKHKFIYIKNQKVAGSSVECIFEKYCINNNNNDNSNNDNSSNNVVGSHYTDENVSEAGVVGGRLSVDKYHQGIRYKNWPEHISLREVKKRVGDEKFNSYFKFCVVRNPWDQIVSKYFYAKNVLKSINPNMTFDRFVRKVYNSKDIWTMIIVDGKPSCDYYIKFEDLNKGIVEVAQVLDINDIDLDQLPHFNSNVRPKDKSYQEYYTEETKNLVYNGNKEYIEYFNYEF